MPPIRILLVEDQTLMRQGLKTILDLEPGLTVVGEAARATRVCARRWPCGPMLS